MSGISRREFLAGTTATIGAAAIATPGLLAAEEAAAEAAAETATKFKSGTDIVTLGKTGIKTSILGVGTGTGSGSEQARLGQEGLTKLLHEAFDRGIRYFDTAMMYQSHEMVGVALKELPRDKFFVQTKINLTNPTAQSAQRSYDNVRSQLGLEQLDTVLMHCLTNGNWPRTMGPLMDLLRKEKEKGAVRAIGISMHSMAALAAIPENDFCDVCLVRVNPFRVNTDGPIETTADNLKKIKEKEIGVIGMKIYGEGRLREREQRLESLKYVLGLGTVDCFTIGFSRMEQIEETLALIDEAKVPVEAASEESEPEDAEPEPDSAEPEPETVGSAAS
jgi:predicted aldo/keto reductase-like oxidoreductase